MQGSHTFKGRFQHLRRRAVEPLQVEHAIGLCVALHCLQGRQLRGIRGHHQFAAALVRNMALGAVVVQHLAALHTQACFERTRGVVKARMDDLAVARACAGTHGVRRLQHQYLAPLQRQRTRHRQSHHASTHHHAIDRIHHTHSFYHQACSKPSSTFTALVPSSAAA